jgi:hypothetical protein
MIVAIYARVSTTDQSCEMQLHELREYVSRRGWEFAEAAGRREELAKRRRNAESAYVHPRLPHLFGKPSPALAAETAQTQALI